MNDMIFVASSGAIQERIFEIAGPVLSFGPVVLLAYLFLRYRQTKVRGPSVSGTAEILSLKVARWVIGNPGRGERPCVLGLRVQVPGREAYEVSIRQHIEQFALALRVQPGRIVPVEVGEANPQHVRIDLSQPVGSGGPHRVVVNAPPTVRFTQSSSPEVVTSSAPVSPEDFGDILKTFGASPNPGVSADADPAAPARRFVVDWAHAELGSLR
ncbi:hypothetical protein [Mycobacterium sp. URHB0044]|jgi:hypothetical protein|uniref:hypothetical protein n=1 Tax=Mycobacterium sp. URHB0044 TaxID=1380386 RepID=UPI00048C1272|nr:hypothetical protein [Mycobacterium sp. URHB0044]